MSKDANARFGLASVIAGIGLLIMIAGILQPLLVSFMVGAAVMIIGGLIGLVSGLRATSGHRHRPVVVGVIIVAVAAGALVVPAVVDPAVNEAGQNWTTYAELQTRVLRTGDRILIRDDDDVELVDLRSGRVITRLPGEGDLGDVVVGADGSFVVLPSLGPGEHRVSYYGPDGGKRWTTSFAMGGTSEEVVAIDGQRVVLLDCRTATDCNHHRLRGIDPSGRQTWSVPTSAWPRVDTRAKPFWDDDWTDKAVRRAPAVAVSKNAGHWSVRTAAGQPVSRFTDTLIGVRGKLVLTQDSSCQVHGRRAGQEVWKTDGMPCLRKYQGRRDHLGLILENTLYLQEFPFERPRQLAVDLSTGRWRLMTRYLRANSLFPGGQATDIAADTVITARRGNMINAEDAVTGKPLWSHRIPHQTRPSDVRVDAGDGAVIISFETPSLLSASLSELSGNGHAGREFMVLDARTGDVAGRLVDRGDLDLWDASAYGVGPGRAVVVTDDRLQMIGRP